jgi:(5-formylfuran-3-yl)methyl phosphate synthase
MKILVSVRSVAEARIVADGGVDFIDLKEPGAGALGALAIPTVAAIVAAMRGSGLPVSATIGDLPMTALAAILERVAAVGDCGVDYVKVGIEREDAARTVVDALAACGRPIVPVFIADRGFDDDLVAHAAGLGFPALMADTADKLTGSLFERMPRDVLERFVRRARSGGALVGLAGALRLADEPRLRALAPDFAGFRSAVCVGDRRAALDAGLLRALVRRLRTEPVTAER